MKKNIKTVISIYFVVSLIFVLSMNIARADDGVAETDAQQFEVTKQVYDAQYKNDPNYELIKQYTCYRYSTRTKSTTTSGKDSLAGWTKYDTKSSTSTSDYKYGTPISTSTSYANNRKTVTSAVNKGYYYYAYAVANPSDGSDWTYYVDKSRAAVISHMKANFSDSSKWAEKRLRYFWYISSSDLGSLSGKLNKTIPYCADSTVTVPTTSQKGTHLYDLKLYKYKQCYKVKTDITTYYYYQWSAWSAWSSWSTNKQTIPSDGSKKEETEERCLIKLVKNAKQLNECDISVDGPDTFEYDGGEKSISIIVRDEGEELEQGKDYVVYGNSGVDAGIYDVSIMGIGDYSGEKKIQFTIEKTNASLDFENRNVTKGVGAEDFINEISIITDGQISYQSSDNNVATVALDGTVSIVNQGRTTITARAKEGKNYLPAESSYELVVAKNLYDCEIQFIGSSGFTTGSSSFTYDGEEKRVEFEIYDNDYKLIPNIDYTVEGNTGTDVGEYILTISGKGEYVGKIEKEYAITKAKPRLLFDSNSITKELSEDTFANHLESVTDGKISYSSSNDEIASVDQFGNVTIKKPGNILISARADEGKNYKSGQASYSLTIVENARKASLEDLSFAFVNSRNDFGYDENYTIPAKIYRTIFGPFLGNHIFSYAKHIKWGGNCAGLSATAALLFDKENDIHVKSFNPQANLNSELKVSDMTNEQLSLKEFIESMQVAQRSSLFQETDQRYMVNSIELESEKKNLNTIFNTIKEQTNAGIPVLVSVRCKGKGGHALLAYDTEENGSDGRILVYDSNYPLNRKSIELSRDKDGNWAEWSYNMGARHGIWGIDDGYVYSIGLVPYSVLKTIWDNKGELQKNYNLLNVNSQNVEIYDVEDSLLVKVVDGKVVKNTYGITVHGCDLSLGSEDESLMISMPIDVYTVKNKSKSNNDFNVQLVNTEVSAKVSTSAEQVSLAASDEYDLNQVSFDASTNDYYDVKLDSVVSEENSSVEIKGKGIDKTVSISQTDGFVTLENCEVLSLNANNAIVDQNTITAKSYGHGNISPSGKTSVASGSNKVYTIKPDPGYVIQDVLVDDKSVGDVNTYTFEKVSGDHEIVAVFETAVNYKRIKNTIHSKKKIVKSVSNRKQTLNLGISTDGITKLMYYSSSNKVRVSSKGIVTIAPYYVGKTTITIVSLPNTVFEQETAKINIVVKPAIPKKIKVKKREQNVVIVWKRIRRVNGYQIQLLNAKKKPLGKIKTIKNGKKCKLRLKCNKNSKFVRVRSFKKTPDGIIYSSWSKVKRVRK